MKKLVYLALAAALPLAANAQSITLTQSNAPQIGEVWMDLEDNRFGQHTITNGGASQTWDYSSSFLVDDTAYTNFVSVASVPSNFSANFQSAHMATYSANDTAALFFKSTPSGFYLDGIGSVPVTIQGVTASSFPFNPDRLIVPAPFTFGDSRNHTAKMVAEGTMQGMQFRLELTTTQNFQADAYGSLTTPGGVFPNTLRVREYSTTIDTAYVNLGFGWQLIPGSSMQDTALTYTWYRNGLGARVMTITADHANPATSLSASYLNTVLVSAPENKIDQASVNVFPNPAASQPVSFAIDHKDAARLVISDMLGRQIQTENVTGINSLSISTNRYQSGTYFYSVTDKNGRKLNDGRFVVIK